MLSREGWRNKEIREFRSSEVVSGAICEVKIMPVLSVVLQKIFFFVGGGASPLPTGLNRLNSGNGVKMFFLPTQT